MTFKDIVKDKKMLDQLNLIMVEQEVSFETAKKQLLMSLNISKKS